VRTGEQDEGSRCSCRKPNRPVVEEVSLSVFVFVSVHHNVAVPHIEDAVALRVEGGELAIDDLVHTHVTRS
jgi:hypothetical protein